MRSIWEPLFYKYGVDLVYTGHVHAVRGYSLMLLPSELQLPGYTCPPLAHPVHSSWVGFLYACQPA